MKPDFIKHDFQLNQYFNADNHSILHYRFRRSRSEVLCKKMLLIISQNSQETPVSESLFNKVAGLRPATLSKRDSGTDVFL